MRLKESSGSFSIDVEKLSSVRDRMKGLRGRDLLAEGEGVLIKTRQVHTFGMRYPIDVVYLSGKGEVKKALTLRPRRLGPLVLGSGLVIEMMEGEIARLGIRSGMRLAEEAS